MSSPAKSDAPASSTRGLLSAKAMELQRQLDALDSSEDENQSPKVTENTHRSRSASAEPTGLEFQERKDDDDADGGGDEDEDEDEDDEDILRPRGRLAARMLGQTSETTLTRNAEEDARERVKRMLNIGASAKDSKTTEKKKASEDEDDDDIVVPRCRKPKPRRQQQRSATPEAAPAWQREGTGSPSLFVSPRREDSPGLFVSPRKYAVAIASGSDSDDLPADPRAKGKSRVEALLARKRAERQSREAEQEKKRAALQQRAMEMEDDDDSGITDDEGGHKLTQDAPSVGGARAQRKASKKAMEDMNRETQRMARSLQLAHEAKTRKKITKNALFDRFNFKPTRQGAGDTASTAAAGASAAEKQTDSSRPDTPVSGGHHTDSEMRDAETPPSSPPLGAKQVGSEKATSAPAHAQDSMVLDEEEDLPTLNAILEAGATQRKQDKGKGKATAEDFAREDRIADLAKGKRQVRVRLPVMHTNVVSLDDDDDDLEVQPSRKSKLDAIFARAQPNEAQESRSLKALRRLAHLDDPDLNGAPVPLGKKGARKQQQAPPMTAAELQMSLMQRARLQAKLERDRQVEALRVKGVHVQTAEEREREMATVDDIVARARREAEEIMDRERDAAKKDRKEKREKGEADPLAWDDSEDDENYVEEEEEEGVEREVVDISGSEEEEEEEEDDGENEDVQETDGAAALFDEDADESQDDGDAEEHAGDDESGSEQAVTAPKRAGTRRSRKQVTILSDDEDEEEMREAEQKAPVEATPRPKSFLATKSPASGPSNDSPQVPTSVLRSANKSFIPGLPVPLAGPAGLGLTQIFAGTMDDSQVLGSGNAGSPSQPRPTFEDDFGVELPHSNFSQTARDIDDVDLILDSQPTQRNSQTQRRDFASQQTGGVQLGFSQSQVHGFDSLLRDSQQMLLPTQASDLLEPTQDGGFRDFSPLKQRFVEAPESTVSTVAVDQTPRPVTATMGSSQVRDDDHNDSPLIRRAGKLRRRAEMNTSTGTSADHATVVTGPSKPSAFSVMRDAAAQEKKRKELEAFNKKKSKAREMIEEQAEESEDEYAGLGGADGEDESDNDDAASVKEMLDDETNTDEFDERKLAAFYAEAERASDEKQIDKLFRDVTTGMLRRKRGAGGGAFGDDLSDSDDGGAARRRMKRRQFARMQRALFADERVSKVAENPRNQAFLRTIEDVGSDDDMDFLMAPPPIPATSSTAGERDVDNGEDQACGGETRAESAIPDSQPQTTMAQPPQRPAAAQRRTKNGKKPSNIGEIRESLSNLLDEPHNPSIVPATDFGSDSEDEDGGRDNNDNSSDLIITSSNKENRAPRRTVAAAVVVDRIALKRTSSSMSSASSSRRLAFAASASAGSFKVPALLRRATTNNSLASTSSSSNAEPAAASASTTMVKNSGSRRSGVNFAARENERRAKLAVVEKRREARKVRSAEGRASAVSGLFGAGRFE